MLSLSSILTASLFAIVEILIFYMVTYVYGVWFVFFLFFFRSSVAPSYGFMILNRLNNENMLEEVAPHMEFRVQSPFVLFKKKTGGH